MKHLSSYKEVKEICVELRIENWSIGKDGLVNVDGNVNLNFKNFKKLPLNFGRIDGSFYCRYSGLTSLEGAPKKVSGNFYCGRNKLINLEGGPEEIGLSFDCGHNNLTSLEEAPKEVGGNFDCIFNKLTSLEGIPFDIKRLDCWINPIYKIWDFINAVEYLQEFVEVYDVVRPGKVVILEYLNDIRKLMGEKPVKREEIPDDWEILDI